MCFSDCKKFFSFTVKYIRENVDVKELEVKYYSLLQRTIQDLLNSLKYFENSYYDSIYD